jgi:fructan beta-fructosidase
MNRATLTAAAALAIALGAAAGDDRFRPLVHFSPTRNWTNDPCGLVFANGEYHLFFQHNPFGDQWGHMSWGHATSRDLIQWSEQPVAIPEAPGEMIFTGSAVVDRTNSSGLCDSKEIPNCIAAIYTGHREGSPAVARLEAQHLAISMDNARTFRKYSGNPVLDRGLGDFRDPKVFWHAASSKWVMLVLAPLDRKAFFYSSTDLKRWTLLSEFGPAGAPVGIWECPDIFELPVENGTKGETRWVFKLGINPGNPGGGSAEQYFVGRFDGTRFVNDNPASTILWLDQGRDCYCALSWNHEPGTEGTQVSPRSMMGWMNNWDYAGKLPTEGWRGQMTIPRTIALRRMPEGLRLVQKPVAALERRRGPLVEVRESKVASVNRRLATVDGPALDIETEIGLGTAKRVEIVVRNAVIAYEVPPNKTKPGELSVDRSREGLMEVDSKFPSRAVAALRAGRTLKLRVLADADSLEVFAAEGSISITSLIFPKPGAKSIQYSAFGGAIRSAHVKVYSLTSVVSP